MTLREPQRATEGRVREIEEENSREKKKRKKKKKKKKSTGEVDFGCTVVGKLNASCYRTVPAFCWPTSVR